MWPSDRRTQQDDAASDAEKAKRVADVAEVRVDYTPTKKVEVTEQVAVCHDSMMQQMNENDYDGFCTKDN
jgi:hypothetical protein